MNDSVSLTPDKARQALPILEQAAANGDVRAAFMLAQWHLAGNLIPRDLPRARSWFERAAELGSSDARLTAIGWLAAGTAGRADWGEAMAQLEDFARTDADAAAELFVLQAMALAPNGDPIVTPEGERLSGEPLVVRFPVFATTAECDQLIAMSRPRLRPAVIQLDDASRKVHANVRTCHAMGYPLAGESPFIHAINRRIAAASKVPASHGEPTQIFRYDVGQEFKPHTDAGPPFSNQREWTFLIYLNDDYEGGETRFIKIGLNVKGRRGDAIMFRNVDERGEPDPITEHWGAPVIRGTKWLLSRWICQRPLEY